MSITQNTVQKGDVVIATAGKEKNQIFVVIEKDGKYCYLVDGKRLKIVKPKKKSLKHVQRASKTPFPMEGYLDKKKTMRKFENF